MKSSSVQHVLPESLTVRTMFNLHQKIDKLGAATSFSKELILGELVLVEHLEGQDRIHEERVHSCVGLVYFLPGVFVFCAAPQDSFSEVM